MGQKQQQSTANLDHERKKKRRVAFSKLDCGVEANDCIKIFLVSSKEEVGATDSFVIEPVDLNGFFNEDGKIYGYKELKITIWISSVSFHSYADITFQNTSDGGRGVTDLKASLQTILAETLVDNKDEFLQTFSTERGFLQSAVSNGEILQHKISNGHINCNSSDASNSNEVVVRMVAGNMETGHLYSRIIPLVLLLVDGSSPIDVTDPRWELYLLIQKKDTEQKECQLIGFAAVYHFYHYPDGSRLRLSQILVLPPYQGKGYGRHLLWVLNDVAVSENVFDFTIEEPLDQLQFIRTFVDTLRLIQFKPIQRAVGSAVSLLQQWKLSKKVHSPRLLPPSNAVEEVRRSLKINKKQFLQCWEVLIYLSLNPVDKHMKDFVTIVSNRMRYDIFGKDSSTTGKRLTEVPSDYDTEMSFVMFRSEASDSSSVQMDDNQPNQEEQLQKLVEERVKVIKSIAEKLSLPSVQA